VRRIVKGANIFANMNIMSHPLFLWVHGIELFIEINTPLSGMFLTSLFDNYLRRPHSFKLIHSNDNAYCKGNQKKSNSVCLLAMLQKFTMYIFKSLAIFSEFKVFVEFVN